MTNNKLINWFIPADKIRGRTNVEMARIFVFTHLFGPLIAQPMAIYLFIYDSPDSWPLWVMVGAICSFWALAFMLRFTGNMMLCTLMSFQGLTTASLFGTFHYGGFSSPFLPWLIVSLLLGFFYLSKRVKLVLALFIFDVVVFLGVLAYFGFPTRVPIEDLRMLGWLSIAAATTYMWWMALYYARMIAMRSELELEAERYLQASSELQRTRKIAEKINRNRSTFFSKMSHELRTPLNAIIGYSELLLEDCEERSGDNKQRLKDITRINTAGKHLMSLVSEVLDNDTMEDDQTRVDITSFTLGELCDDVVANALPLVEKNNNEFVVDCPRPNDVVTTDRQKLQQMLINLLSNAGKFTENGTVTLHAAIDGGVAEDRLHANVSDTGIGISQESLGKLFDQYIQADSTISNRFGGTGIGLSISRKFSILLGGAINVSSTPGKGSVFSIDIPARLDPADVEQNDARIRNSEQLEDAAYLGGMNPSFA
ncbi:sensor histidine kinase [Pseudahrensia aquimaris]|uniref:histidine kinase n=1 Tax=Pseudahrensia aquimaris TaxID=744461 RepID=A0ABW3FH27_9HYPH